MKKVIITCFAILSFSSAFSQFSQGNFIVGGMSNLGLSFTTAKVKSGGTTTTLNKTTAFNIQPMGGYFVIDNLAAGLGLSISSSSTKDDGSSDKTVSSSTAVTPFIRYYIDKFYFQGEFRFGSQKDKNTTGATTIETKYSLGGWSLAGGYPIFLSDAISIEPQVGYISQSLKVKDTDVKRIDGGIFIGIGVYAYISK